MLEIVFGESACGSLKAAQGYGKGKYLGGAVSVILHKENDAVPTAEEVQAAQTAAEERARQAWETAVPMEGENTDVYCFALALSVGDLSDDGIGAQRSKVLGQMLTRYDIEDIEAEAQRKIKKTRQDLSELMQRYTAGEPIRIWYSDNPDELCGLYWLMARLEPLKCQTAVYMVKLPAWEYGAENTVVQKLSWGETASGEWGRYLSLQEKVEPAFLSACASCWKQLKEKNAPLRVVLNGRIQNAPEDFYDSFILRELWILPDTFRMPVLIGNVLGKYQLGIGLDWIARRIEKMIGDGLLEVVEAAPEGQENYRCVLRKTIK